MSFLGLTAVIGFLLLVVYFTEREIGIAGLNKLVSRWRRDPTAWSLLSANLVTIFYFGLGKVEARELIFIYWGQGVIITLLSILFVLLVPNYSTKDFTLAGRHLPPVFASKLKAVGLASVFYTVFQIMYLGGILRFLGTTLAGPSWSEMKIPLLLFASSHGFSLIYFWFTRRGPEKVGIGEVLSMPFKRFLPMHLIIIFGALFGAFGFLPLGLVFVGLKTGADLFSHGWKHYPLK